MQVTYVIIVAYFNTKVILAYYSLCNPVAILHLAVICSSRFVCKSGFARLTVDYCENQGSQRIWFEIALFVISS